MICSSNLKESLLKKASRDFLWYQHVRNQGPLAHFELQPCVFFEAEAKTLEQTKWV